jgi:hypothetical protein
MGFLKNLAKKAAIKATRNELDGLKHAISEFPQRSVGGVLQAAANSRSALSENLPHPYNLYFTVSVISPRADIQKKEQIRKGIALLLPELTELERDSDDVITKWAVHFWRVVLMAMLHDELYEEGKILWRLVLQVEDEDESPLYDLRPSYYYL